MTVFTVHIAGTIDAVGVQRCYRCGAILVDSRGAMSIDREGMSFWACGGFVGIGGACSVLMSRDAIEIDEIRCGSSLQ